jgi:hypothetical protein
MDKCTTAAIQYLPTLVSGMHNWKTHLKFNDLAFEFTNAGARNFKYKPE